MGTNNDVVMSLVEQWVDVVSVGIKTVTTVAVFLERASSSSLPFIFSCSTIESIVGPKNNSIVALLASGVISLGVDQEPVVE